MEEERLKAILESLLLAAGEPVSAARLAAVLDGVPQGEIRQTLGALAQEYAAEGRGIALQEVAGGYQLRTARDNAEYVRRLLAARPPRLSRPLMETLAIIAYRQPVTRPEIEQLRGVDCGGVLETLLERRLVRIAGRKEAPGRPIVYATTAEFLEVFGLKDILALPDLEEFKELEGVAPQEVAEAEPQIAAFPDVPVACPAGSAEDAPASEGPVSCDPCVQAEAAPSGETASACAEASVTATEPQPSTEASCSDGASGASESDPAADLSRIRP